MPRHTDPSPQEELSHPIFAAILQAAPDAIIAVNPKQEIIFFNRKAEELFSCPAIEVLGKPVTTLLPSLLPPDISTQESGKVLETVARRGDGGTFQAEAGIGRTETVFTLILRDISERKRAEEEVQSVKTKLETTLESMNDAVFISDVEGNFINFNEAFATFHRFKNKGECARTLIEYPAFLDVYLASGELARLDQWAVPRALRGESGTAIEYGLQRKDTGQSWTGSYSFAPIRDRSGAIVGSVVVGRDITEIKKAAEALQKEQKILQLFIEHAPAAIAMFDNDMRYIAASRRFLLDYEVKEQNIIGKTHYEVFPEIPERWKEIHRRCLNGATERCDEDPFPRANGKLDWMRWEIRPWYEATGKIGGIILFSEMITQQKEAIEALRQSEQKFRDFFHKHVAAKLVIDPTTGQIVDANEAAEKFYGWPREKLLQMYIYDINTLSRKGLKAEIKKAIDQQRIRFEFVHRLADGSLRDVEVYTTKVDVNGKTMLYSIVHDITDRKRAEETVKRHTERLENLHLMDKSILMAIETPQSLIQVILKNTCHLVKCRQASIGIFNDKKKTINITTIDDSGKTIFQVNKQLSSSYYADFEILQTGKMEIVNNDRPINFPKDSERMIEVEKTIHAFINVPLRSDKGMVGILNLAWEHPGSFAAEELDIATEVANQIAIAIEQERLRAEIAAYTAELEKRVAERTAMLEASNKDLESFAYSVSHDLRAPLRGINGFALILEQEYANVLDDDGQSLLDNIRSNANKMDHLITDLLTLSRANHEQLNYTPVEMNALVRTTYNDLATPEVLEKFTFKVSNLPNVSADLTLLRQVWTNLISNAIKYTSHQPDPQIEIDGYTEQSNCIYLIRDNGVGFNPHYKDRLFGIFQRLHQESEFEGTGVGLTIVQRIIQRHGGRVWAESEPGKGATFYVSLPEKPEGNASSSVSQLP
jgi:PAS domain S-box-containing protein